MVPPHQVAEGTATLSVGVAVVALLVLGLAVMVGVTRALGGPRRMDEYPWRQKLRLWRKRSAVDWMLWHAEMDGRWGAGIRGDGLEDDAQGPR